MTKREAELAKALAWSIELADRMSDFIEAMRMHNTPEEQVLYEQERPNLIDKLQGNDD